MLITAEYVKERFPLWNKFFLDDDGIQSEEVLEMEIELAEAELAEYVIVDEDTITDSVKRHLLNIVKYRGFMRLHGDEEFEKVPRIVKDYEMTILKLSAFRDSKGSLEGLDIADTGAVVITSKSRVFDKWFNAGEDDE